jgi:hypothetical protein
VSEAPKGQATKQSAKQGLLSKTRRMQIASPAIKQRDRNDKALFRQPHIFPPCFIFWQVGVVIIILKQQLL